MVENIICPICNSHNWRGQKPSAMGLNHPEWWIKLCAEPMLTLQRTEIGIDINLAFPRKESSTGIFSISVRIYWKITWRDLEGNPACRGTPFRGYESNLPEESARICQSLALTMRLAPSFFFEGLSDLNTCQSLVAFPRRIRCSSKQTSWWLWNSQLFDIFVNPHGPQNAERCQVNFQNLNAL